MTSVPEWSVYDGSTLILTIVGEPGPITSTAPPPPGFVPVQNPFLSAAARDADHEDQLGQLLGASSSLDDFLTRLRGAGFRVVETR